MLIAPNWVIMGKKPAVFEGFIYVFQAFGPCMPYMCNMSMTAHFCPKYALFVV